VKRVELVNAENFRDEPGPVILVGEIMYDHKGFYWKCDGMLLGPWSQRSTAIAGFKAWARGS
jgi:hypothetical protein